MNLQVRGCSSLAAARGSPNPPRRTRGNRASPPSPAWAPFAWCAPGPGEEAGLGRSAEKTPVPASRGLGLCRPAEPTPSSRPQRPSPQLPSVSECEVRRAPDGLPRAWGRCSVFAPNGVPPGEACHSARPRAPKPALEGLHDAGHPEGRCCGRGGCAETAPCTRAQNTRAKPGRAPTPRPRGPAPRRRRYLRSARRGAGPGPGRAAGASRRRPRPRAGTNPCRRWGTEGVTAHRAPTSWTPRVRLARGSGPWPRSPCSRPGGPLRGRGGPSARREAHGGETPRKSGGVLPAGAARPGSTCW